MNTATQRRKPARRLSHVAATIGLITLLLIPAAGVRAEMPEAFNDAPEGAQLILLVPNLTRLNDKIALLNNELDLQTPEMANALDSFKREMGMADGVNDDGPLLFVMTDISDAIKEERDPSFAMLVPVSDYDAFVANFGAEAGDGVTELTMSQGQTGYCKRMGNYAVIGESKELISWYEAAKPAQAISQKVGDAAVDSLGDMDVALYIDLEAISPVLIEKTHEFADIAVDEMDAMSASGMMPASAVDMNITFIQLYANAAHGLLEGSRAMVMTLNIDKTGINISHALEMKPNSTMAKMFPGQGSTTAATLSRLPNQPYIFALAFDYAGMDVSGLVNKMFENVPDGENNRMMGMYKDILPMVEQTNSAASVFYPPDPAAMMAGGFLNILNVYEVKDGEKFVEANKAYLKGLNDLEIEVPVSAQAQQDGAADAGAITFATTYTDNAMQIDGVRVDQYSYTQNMPPELLQSMGPMAMFGATGYSGYVAHKDNVILATTSLDAQMITRGIKSSSEKSGIGTGGLIAEMRNNRLPKNCFLEFYLNPGGIASTANMFTAMFGMPPLNVPADTAPLSIGTTRVDNALDSRVYVSLSTIKAVKTALEDMQNNMQQQQRPMGDRPGGAPPAPYN